MYGADRFWLAIAVALVAGCGGGGDGGPDEDNRTVTRIVDSPNRPLALTVADPACQLQNQPVNLETGKIAEWSGELATLRETSLPTLTTRNSLEGSAIRLTTHADLYTRECDARRPAATRCLREDGSQKSFIKNDARPKPVRICSPDSGFERGTIESAALTAAHYIELSYLAYRGAPGATDLDRVHLEINPRYQTILTHFESDERGRETLRQRTHILNNAAYVPNSKRIVTFPHHEEWAHPGYFWESRFVLAHEFGHHVHKTMEEASIEIDELSTVFGLGVEWDPMQHRYRFDDPALATDASIGAFQAKGAMEEAFSDLFAYYTAGGDASSLIGIPCLGPNRNIESDTFGDGSDKIMTEARLTALITGTDTRVGVATTTLPFLQAVGVCEPNFGDIHIGGAIIAYTANSIFQATTGIMNNVTGNSQDDFRLRQGMLVKWFETSLTEWANLAKAAAANSEEKVAGPALWLKPMLKGFEQAITASLDGANLVSPEAPDELKAEICALASQHLPAAGAELPFSTDSGCP